MPPASEHSLARLVDIMARLRAPDGCPWDREQTHRSLVRYAIEEAYEVGAAVDQGEAHALCDELGDLLLQVVFHAQIAAEANSFNIDDVIEAICAKLIRRHPHVFGDVQVQNSQDVVRNWEAIKAAERGGAKPASALAGVKGQLPALMHASEMQKAAAKVGFDWDDAAGPLAKVGEEAAEVIAAAENAPERAAAEWGDLLFALVNVGRHLGFDSEAELHNASARFARRFRYMEAACPDLAALPLAEQDHLWEQAKKAGL